MEQINARLTVLFEEDFWVGIFERETSRGYEVCKVTFGAEPTDCELYRFILDNNRNLRFSRPVHTASFAAYKKNPKRMRREAQKAVHSTFDGTKAQQALKLEYEQGKKLRRVFSKEQREAELRERFAAKQEKRKEKHRGH